MAAIWTNAEVSADVRFNNVHYCTTVYMAMDETGHES